MRLTLLSLMFGLVVLTGCARSPERQFYTLRTASQAIKAPEVTSPKRTLAISSISIPDSVDHNKMISRQPGSHRLEISEIHRWAEPLTTEIATVVADDLKGQFAETLVTTAGQNAGASAPDFRLDLDITRFDGTLGSGIDIEAAWTVRPPNNSPARNGQASIKAPSTGSDYEALARAYTEGLHRLARLIGNTLREGGAGSYYPSHTLPKT